MKLYFPPLAGRSLTAQDETNSYVKGAFNDTQPCEYEDSLLPGKSGLQAQYRNRGY